MREEYRADELLPLSGIQHFAFCRRQWALIHIECAWADNRLTAEGELQHERAHDPTFNEKRGDRLIVRAMPVASATLTNAPWCVLYGLLSAENRTSRYGR